MESCNVHSKFWANNIIQCQSQALLAVRYMRGQIRSMAGFPEMLFIAAEENNKEFWKSAEYFFPFPRSGQYFLNFLNLKSYVLLIQVIPYFLLRCFS